MAMSFSSATGLRLYVTSRTKLCKSERLRPELHPPRLDDRKIQKVLDEPCETVTARSDIREIFALLIIELAGDTVKHIGR